MEGRSVMPLRVGRNQLKNPVVTDGLKLDTRFIEPNGGLAS